MHALDCCSGHTDCRHHHHSLAGKLDQLVEEVLTVIEIPQRSQLPRLIIISVLFT